MKYGLLLTGMASMSPLMMKLAMPGTLATLSLTSAPRFALLSRKRGERSEGGAARQTNRYASFTLTVTVLAMLASPGVVLAEQWWRHVGTIGKRQFVMVSPSAVDDADRLKQAANSVCKPREICVVVFWRGEDAESRAAKRVTLSKRRQIVAQYVRNPFTGSEQLQMRCRKDGTKGSKCI